MRSLVTPSCTYNKMFPEDQPSNIHYVIMFMKAARNRDNRTKQENERQIAILEASVSKNQVGGL